jgi:hypothetical protein
MSLSHCIGFRGLLKKRCSRHQRKYPNPAQTGANAEGGGGFQPGNTCGKEDGGGAESGGDKVLSWAKEKFKDEKTAKNFAEWFKGSKVVDENGEPLVMYHGAGGLPLGSGRDICYRQSSNGNPLRGTKSSRASNQ